MATKKVTKTTTTKRTKKGKVTITQIIEEEVKTNELVNHVIFLLDDSGSMYNCYSTAVQQLNQNIRNVRENALKTGQRTTVSLYLFGGQGVVREVYFQQPLDRLQELNPNEFAHGPSTPLVDAICSAIQRAGAQGDASDVNTSFLLVCATDGGENSSRRFNPTDLAKMVKEAQGTDRWTLAFMVPRGDKHHMIQLGIPEDNVIEWENSRRGAQVAFTAAAVGVSNYYTARSIGQTSTKKFFVETDLSQLTKKEVQTKLDDISSRFKAATVEKEIDIKAFAEEKTGKPYVIGSLYYALTKKEKVQAGKDVLLMEKGKRTVYGGAQARGLIGLPVGVEAMVTPGNHANYDVYVKSTSVNRKLVRGTKVLIDITKVTPDKETWDSAAALAVAEAKKTSQNTTSTTR